MADQDNVAIVVKRKPKRAVTLSDNETILMLRAHQSFPCAWDKIVTDIQNNQQSLPDDAKTLYASSTTKQLKGILSTPQDKIANVELKTVLLKVKKMETQLLEKPTAKKNDKRDNVAQALSSDEDVPENQQKAAEKEA